MNNIITINTNETITSMEVAQMVNKEHKQLLRDIRRYISQIEKSNESITFNECKIAPVEFFIETTYIDVKGESRPCFNVTRKGCEFIANKLTGQKGTEFTARYINKFHDLEKGNITNSLISALNSISESMQTMKSEVNDRLSALEAQTSKQSLSVPKYSRWKTVTFEKFRILMNYVNENSEQNLTLSNIMNLVFNEVQDTYNIDFEDYIYMYKSELGLAEDFKVQTLDIINHYIELKNMFNLTIDSILEKLNLQIEKNNIHKNIFDIFAEKL